MARVKVKAKSKDVKSRYEKYGVPRFGLALTLAKKHGLLYYT